MRFEKFRNIVKMMIEMIFAGLLVLVLMSPLLFFAVAILILLIKFAIALWNAPMPEINLGGALP